MRSRLAYQVGEEKKTEEAEPKPKLGPILGPVNSTSDLPATGL